MNDTYTKKISLKILIVFLAFTILFSVTALVVQRNISNKLKDVANLATSMEHDQSKPEHALLLLHQAEDDFQESLSNMNKNKIIDYKIKLSGAFNEIDTILKQRADTSRLSQQQNIRVKLWYNRKLELSDKLYNLRHTFDSLLTVYNDFHGQNSGATQPLITTTHIRKKRNGDVHSDTSELTIKQRKGLLRRIKDAIANKNSIYAIEINHNKNSQTIDSTTKKILNENRDNYVHKLQILQQQNIKLLTMQRELNRLNTYISNELENIIGRVKDINYNMAIEFKEFALKNYQSTTATLNKFYLAAFLLLLGFAFALIFFIGGLYKAEMQLRQENELTVNTARQKIDELLKKIILEEDKHSPARQEELKEIVELAVNNNPAFLIKFNEFDPGFNNKLLALAPNLVASEIAFCALLRLNFETKEIARYTKTSVRATEGKKYRIRKKLNIPSDQDINVWMTRI